MLRLNARQPHIVGQESLLLRGHYMTKTTAANHAELRDAQSISLSLVIFDFKIPKCSIVRTSHGVRSRPRAHRSPAPIISAEQVRKVSLQRPKPGLDSSTINICTLSFDDDSAESAFKVDTQTAG